MAGEHRLVPTLATLTFALLVLASPLGAALSGVIVPTGRQDYFVLGHEQHVWNMMQRVRSGEGGPAFQNGMNSVVSAVASADGQVVTYDHWEDAGGFEADPWNPVQASTLVLGDGNNANGRACDWTNDPRVAPCNGTNDDVLFRGSALTFNSDQGLASGGCGVGVRCTAPVNPRGSALHFDGGDRLVTSGGPLSLIHNQFPPPYPQIGGSTEVLPRQAFTGATSYSIPAGEDLYVAGGPYQMFNYTSVNIVAFDDATQVFINSPGGGTASFTLNQGQHYTNCLTWNGGTFACNGGGIDGVAAPAVTINASTKISATGPIAILLFSGGDGTWATDFMPILPELLHGNDYILPSPGDDPAVLGSRPLNIYTYNPDPVNAISVSTADTAGTGTIAVPTEATIDYFAALGRYVPTNSTVRLTSNRSFWGLAIHDHLSPANDWGYSWLATDFLTRNYTVSYAPGLSNPPGSWPTCGVSPVATPGLCDSLNRSAVFVAAALDFTLVKVDFDNDGLFDIIDTDSDDFPDPGVATDSSCGGGLNCLYRVDALQTLRIFDYTDYDNTGTRVQASKPIAVAYGQDTDQATGPDAILDTGYTVYPLSQRFLDPVLVVGKTVSPTVVPDTGGQATFTITAQSFSFTPLTSMTVTDLLPAGLVQADYVPGSTLITYPDLSQGTADPTFSIDPGGRTRLTWTLSPDTMGMDQVLTVRFTLNIPAGTAQTFANEAFVSGVYDGRTYNAVGGADVVRTSVALTKGVSDDGAPEPGDVLTYTLQIANNALVAETNVVLTDPIPPGTTFITGTDTSQAPFSSAFDPAQNAVVWTAGSFAAGASATLTFQVRINPDTAIGKVLVNTGVFESSTTPTFFSNEVSTTVVGPTLTATKSIVGTPPPTVLHPNELVTFEVTITNEGASAATNVTLTDPLTFSNATYEAGTMEMSLNGTAFTALTDASDADAGTLNGSTLNLALASLAPSADLRFRFQARVNLVAPGAFVNNQATAAATEVGTTDTNLVQVPVDGDAVVTGHVFLDSNGDGNQDPGEPDLVGISVSVTDSGGVTQVAVTDANGDYSAYVPAGLTTLNVDETDPDMPQGAVLTTANDPQNVTAVSSATVNSPDVGYDLPPLSIIKTSDAGGTALPGQTITYTIAVTNNEGVTQSGIALTDAVPAGTSYLSGTVSGPALRVTEYHVGTTTCGGGAFTGTTCNVTLNDDLLPDYFAIVQGSDGTGADNGTSPDDSYAALAADPFGTGGLAVSSAGNVVQLSRGGTSAGGYSWEGVVTVVECLGGCDTDGFRLLDVQRIVLPTGATADPGTGTVASGTAWTDINQVVLFGAANGAGCETTDGAAANHQICALRLSPSGTQTVNWERRRGGGAASYASATATVMVVEWGTAWNVQRRTITGTAGGNGAAATADYDTAAIASVTRDNTWVWGSANSADNGLGDGPEGILITLGDGQNQNASETLLAAGSEYNDEKRVEAYALTHPGLAVDYRFKIDGDSGLALYSQTVDAAGSQRFALVTNGCNGTGTAYARPIFSARYLNATTVQLQRRRTGQDFPAWVQGIDFSGVTATATAGTPPNVIVPADGWSLPPGATLTVTYQVQVTATVSSGLTQILNTAQVASTQFPGPYTDTATDTLLFLGVEVEPNNAGYAQAGTPITFTHTVLNQGAVNDSYNLAVVSDLGWAIDLIDPDTGVVIARDSDGDGTWDGGVVPNTGTLAPGVFEEYELRVWVPGGTPAGTQDTVTLTGVSSYGLPYSDDAEDEITVLDSTLGDVIVTPDNSGIVRSGSSIAYSHLVINSTGAADTFDLSACSSRLPVGETTCIPEYTVPIHWDTNGDGVYTPGTDLRISNTAQLPDGGSQLIFVVVDAWTGAAEGDVDIAYLTASSRNNPTVLFGAATDTTTFVAKPDHDLSGGGTRVVAPSDVSVHPGTLVNLSTSDDRYDLSISVANLYQVDGLLHPTELWADSNGDGTADTLIATDDEGDGIWNTVDPAWDTDTDGLPDIPVLAGSTASYELRRPVDPDQVIQRDHVTLTSDAITGTTVADSVTATWVFAALTRAGIRGVRVDLVGEVSFVTATQSGTRSFVVFETDDPTGAGREPLHDEAVVSPVPDSLRPILYRVPTRPVTKRFVLIEETETDGDVVWKGPFAVDDERLGQAFDTVEGLMADAGIPRGPIQRVRGMRPLSFAAEPTGHRATVARDRARAVTQALSLQALSEPRRRAADGVKIHVHQPGRVSVPLDALTAAGLRPMRPGGPLVLTGPSGPVPYQWEQDGARAWSIVFQDQGLATDFSGQSVYTATVRSVPRALEVPLTVSADPRVPGFTRVERNALYVPSLPDGPDPWQWDLLFSGGPWPDPGWDPNAGDFDLPHLAPGASGPTEVRIRVVGYTHHVHSVTASINGLPVGSITFDGATEALLTGSIDASSLAPTGNTLSITYVGTDLPDSTEPDPMAYLDYIDLAIPTAPAADATFHLVPYSPRLPRLQGVEYLVVTHPLFRAQADRVAQLKALEGMKAVVVETDAAYDRFSGGIVEPRAIQALVRYAHEHSGGALRFVLLVGDDTFDPRDHVGIGSTTFVPTLYARDSSWGLVPSETPYADLDDDGRPDLAIGRLPVHSPAEADAVVDKIAAQSSALQAFLGAQLVVSDNASETDAPFRNDGEKALALLPQSRDVRWADVTQGTPAARSTLLQGWDDGVLLTHYFGHGGLTEWADEQVLTSADVHNLGSSWKPTVLFTWACLSQWYVGIDGPSLNEALLLQPTGGAVASFGPAGITPPARQAILTRTLYANLALPGVTLGEAIRDAKNQALDIEPNAQEVIEGFHLFGDPALVIPWPAVVPQ